MPPQAEVPQRPPWFELVAGGAAGAVAKTATAPMQRVVILQQLARVEQRGALAALRSVVAHQGFASLWKGNLVTVIHRFPYSGLSFMLYEVCKRGVVALRSATASSTSSTPPPTAAVATAAITPLERAAAGCGAGCGAVLATYPLDTIRTHLAACTSTQRTPIRDVINNVFAAQGVRGLYRGVSISVAQKVPELALQLCVYETAKERLDGFPTPVKVFASASLSGLSSLLFYPCDVVRRNMQVMHVANARDASVWRATSALVRSSGPGILFRGVRAELLRTIPFVVGMWASLEALRGLGDNIFAADVDIPSAKCTRAAPATTTATAAA